MTTLRHTLPMALLAVACLAMGCGGSGIETADVSGTITLNGVPVKGIVVSFVPEAKMRPSTGETDADGKYTARFTKSQSGVVPGPCVVKFAYYRGDTVVNSLPPEWSEKAAENPDLNVTVPAGGLTFDYDIQHDGKLR